MEEEQKKMKDCENCMSWEKGQYNGNCDRCLNNPDEYKGRWIHKDWRVIYERIENLGKTVSALAGAGIAVNSIRSFCEEILMHCDELEGKDTNTIAPRPSPPRPITDEYIDITIHINGEEHFIHTPVIHGTLDLETGEVRKK